ncbi:hypothetical protein ABT330_32295 [Streptomyces sp. NPDC000658]|uniref:hypothetical protein n=1 Tax=Streptomyces sp. NPDC000658 TaxID=3154266 RepID=UPI003319F424
MVAWVTACGGLEGDVDVVDVVGFDVEVVGASAAVFDVGLWESFGDGARMSMSLVG